MMDLRAQLDLFDNAAVRKALVESLREDGGERFRSLLQSYLKRGDKKLYERLINIPELRDLVPH